MNMKLVIIFKKRVHAKVEGSTNPHMCRPTSHIHRLHKTIYFVLVGLGASCCSYLFFLFNQSIQFCAASSYHIYAGACPWSSTPLCIYPNTPQRQERLRRMMFFSFFWINLVPKLHAMLTSKSFTLVYLQF